MRTARPRLVVWMAAIVAPIAAIAAIAAFAAFAAFAAVPAAAQQVQPARGAARPTPGVRIEALSWNEAEKLLDSATVVVIPLGAQAKEHGPQLPLNNDWLLAEYFTKRVVAKSNVVVYPTINYSFYPAFVEYPGSTTLRLETARDMVVGIIRTIARHGPDRL